jgi:hypothetical protein
MVISWSGLFVVVVTRARSHLGMIVADGHRGKAESATGAQGQSHTRRYRSRMRRRIRDRRTFDSPDDYFAFS